MSRRGKTCSYNFGSFSDMRDGSAGWVSHLKLLTARIAKVSQRTRRNSWLSSRELRGLRGSRLCLAGTFHRVPLSLFRGSVRTTPSRQRAQDPAIFRFSECLQRLRGYVAQGATRQGELGGCLVGGKF